MSRELVIYCDESDISGRHFANFYGGAVVESRHLAEVVARLEASKARLNFHGEVKWQKITENYAQKYIEFVGETFKLMVEGKLKLRIMFTQNYYSAHRLTTEQRENGFFLLYYQFVKHAFGLRFAGAADHTTAVRIYFDKLPDTAEKCAAFKGFITGLSKNRGFRDAELVIRQDQIAEVDSKEHVVLQALDVVLGAMQFRLNDKHLEKPEGARVRGKRTIAKERVYKHVNLCIRDLYGGKQFNIGVSTGRPDPATDHEWVDPYRHWLFNAKRPSGEAGIRQGTQSQAITVRPRKRPRVHYISVPSGTWAFVKRRASRSLTPALDTRLMTCWHERCVDHQISSQALSA